VRGSRIAIVVAVALGALPAAAGAAPKPGTVVEHKVHSLSPDHRQVRESLVRIYDPLPASAGEHPPACDWIQYLRFRHAGGPKDPRDAAAVLSIIPGFLAGAGSFEQVGRHAVRAAAGRGADVEFWAIDRRANCLEDYHGIRAATRAEDATVAWDYYWGDREIDGKRFAGFVSHEDAAFLDHIGIQQTMEDWYTINRTGMPGRRTRERKMICGGHSLGGPLTSIYASWDFDGDPETTRDAGYRNCAGLVGLDTSFGFSGMDSSSAGGGEVAGAVADSGAAPYVDAPPLTPETIGVLNPFAVGAYFDPDGTDLIDELPHSTNIDFSQRVLFSKDAAQFATGTPDIREFNLTNESNLAGVLDDNSAGISILRAGLGQAVGGPLADKNFPAPGGGTLAIPEDPATPLYSWEDYRTVGAPGHAVELNDEGQPYTSRESETTDIHQLARGFFETRADFTEHYFPTRILTDLAPAASGGFEQMKYDGPHLKPGLLIHAGDSDDNSAPDDGPPFEGEPPNDLEHSLDITVPGYNHLDVGTAAWRQNDGRPEPSSAALAEFALAVTRPVGG
jgi:hypothetical protein